LEFRALRDLHPVVDQHFDHDFEIRSEFGKLGDPADLRAAHPDIGAFDQARGVLEDHRDPVFVPEPVAQTTELHDQPAKHGEAEK